MAVWIVSIAALLWAIGVARAALVAAHMFQIEEYEWRRLLAWSRQRAWLLRTPSCLAALVALVGGIPVPSLSHVDPHILAGIGWFLGMLAFHLSWRRTPAKKPLVYTRRMQRIVGAAAVVLALVTAAIVIIVLMVSPLIASIITVVLSLGIPALAPFLIIAGDALMRPVERRIRERYVQAAEARLSEINPATIAIAGSYGKTSTKHITAALLSAYMPTLATPKSFNTLMGVTRTINENLDSPHRSFVVEMDAYGPGEITSMCKLVRPRMAVITSVGPQHLERFGTQEAIANALYEVVEELPPGAPAIIYCGDPQSQLLAERATSDGYNVVRYGIDDDLVHLDVVASDIQIDERDTCFRWTWADEGLDYLIRIPLLGKHNILNVSAALAVVHLMGLPLPDAVAKSARLDPVPHRLQRMPGSGGITIIDDSYNANPVGIHNGLDVLRQFKGEAKILVTPGLVELGPIEESENRMLGEHAASVCDHVILVGKRQTQPIYAGLRSRGFDDARIHSVQTLDEVTQTLGKITRQGDVVLFANDLPDVYLEIS